MQECIFSCLNVGQYWLTYHSAKFLQLNKIIRNGKIIWKGSPVRISFAAEHEFPKMLVPRLPQNTSSVNIESTGKLKQLYYLCDHLLGFLIYLYFIVLILLCFQLIMPGVNYAINGCSSSSTTLRA